MSPRPGRVGSARRAADAEDKVPLLDVNVLVALAWPSHIHHQAAQTWFGARPQRPFATAPVTQSGFVRVSSNARAIPQAQTPQAAHALLVTITALPGHLFWADDESLANSSRVAWQRLGGHSRVTDAHMLAIALRHGGRLATFDRAVANLVPAGAATDAILLLS